MTHQLKLYVLYGVSKSVQFSTLINNSVKEGREQKEKEQYERLQFEIQHIKRTIFKGISKSILIVTFG